MGLGVIGNASASEAEVVSSKLADPTIRPRGVTIAQDTLTVLEVV